MNFTFDDQEIDTNGKLPDKVDAIVIGGGVIGTTAALYLRRKGLSVALLEKGRVAGEQSSRNWGWVRTQGRDPDEISVALEARQLWADLDRETGGATGLRTCGSTFLAESESDLANYDAWLQYARAHDLETRILSQAETSDLLGGHHGGGHGAIHTPSDLCAEPWVAVPEIARLAREEGVRVFEGCAVRGLDISGGKVAGVITERGRIASDCVILAGGAWSALLLRRHGLSIPQLSVRSNVVATAPLSLPDGCIVAKGWAVRRRADGGTTIAPSGFNELYIGPDALRAFPRYWPGLRSGYEFDYRFKPLAPIGFPDAWTTPRNWSFDRSSPFEQQRVLNPAPNDAALDRGIARVREVFGLSNVPEVQRWAGMIDVLPDVVPVVDRVEQLPGLTLATGMCGHGFGIGPAFGRIAADLATGDAPGHDMSRFRLSRFFDGSPMTIGPAI